MKYSKLLLSVLLSLSASSFVYTQSWYQRGLSINGENAGDNSGISVCMPDLNTIAVGSSLNDDTGIDAGQVRIFRWNGTSWVQKGADINGQAAGDWSGYSLSMPDSNTVAIGAYRNNSFNGQVRIFTWDGSAWIQKGFDLNGTADMQLGYSVSMPDADNIAIGATHADEGQSNSGQVRVYYWTGTYWAFRGSFINGESQNDLSGCAVSMPDVNTLAIGANLNDGNGLAAGHARIYRWNGNDWVQKGADIDGEAAGDNAGWAVSMPDSNTVAVGAYLNGGNGIESGHVRIYSWNGNAWIQRGIDLDGESFGSRAGISVSMPNSNTVAIGSANNSGNGASSGNVRVYKWNGNAWIQFGVDIDGEAAQDNCGRSVSMPDEFVVATGAPGNDGNGLSSGHTRIFAICESSSDLTTEINGASISSNNANASYQWLDCNNNFAIIAGETNQSFSPLTNGNYAVQLNENGCIDTSACVNITTVGWDEDFSKDLFSVYPNPLNNKLHIALQHELDDVNVIVRNVMGEILIQKNFVSTNQIEIMINLTPGLYFIELSNAKVHTVQRVIKE